MEKRRIFWSILSIVVVAMLSFGLSSCNKDDDGDGEGGGANDSRIVGTWHFVSKESWEYTKGVLVDHRKENATSTRIYEVVNGKETGKYRDSCYGIELVEYTFGVDGSFYAINDDADEESGTYIASNGNLKLTVGNFSGVFKYSYSGDQLIITMEESNGKELEYRSINYLDKGPYSNK